MKKGIMTAILGATMSLSGCKKVENPLTSLSEYTSNEVKRNINSINEVNRNINSIDRDYLDTLYLRQLENGRTIQEIEESAINLLVEDKNALPVVSNLLLHNKGITQQYIKYLDLYLIFSIQYYTETSISNDLKIKKDEN